MESCITVLVLYGELSVVSQEDLNDFFVTLMTGHLESRLPRTLLVHLQVISTPWVVSILTSQTVLVKPLQSIKRLSVTKQHYKNNNKATWKVSTHTSVYLSFGITCKYTVWSDWRYWPYLGVLWQCPWPHQHDLEQPPWPISQGRWYQLWCPSTAPKGQRGLL